MRDLYKSIDYIERGMLRMARLLDELAPYYGQTADFRARFGYGEGYRYR